MFCPKCGKRVEDGALFCNFCGAQLPAAQKAAPASQASQAVQGSQRKEAKQAPKKPLIWIAVIAIVVIIAGIAAFFYFKGASDSPVPDASQLEEAPSATARQSSALSSPAPSDASDPSSASVSSTAAPQAQEEPQVTDCFTFVRSDYVSGLEEWEQYEIHIPEIQLSGSYSAVNSINREIKEKYLADGEAWASDPSNTTGGRNYGDIKYDWYRNDDVLSLVISASFCNYDGIEYQVYNISVSTGQQLSNSELVSRAGWTEDSYQSSVKEALLSQYWEKAGPAMDSMKSSGDLTEGWIAGYRSLYENTVSFAQEAAPFLGENGDLYIIGSFGVNAGGGSETRRINLSSYSISPYYSEDFVAPSLEAPKTAPTQTVWRLVSSSEDSYMLYEDEDGNFKSGTVRTVNNFSYDETGNLSSVTIEYTINGITSTSDDVPITYNWDESEQCLLSLNRRTRYFDAEGRLTEQIYTRGGITDTYTYDSDGYPCSCVSDDDDDNYLHTEYYCEKSDLGNGKIRLDWYSDAESLQGELQWYAIYQDGRMIEYTYWYLEPYTITFQYEQVELPTEQIPPYLSSLLITPNEYVTG